MSGVDGLQLDADGYLDMDQFPDDGTDLADADLDQLREVLHGDPVEEPTPEQWDTLFDDALAGADDGPFAVSAADDLFDGGDGVFTTDDGLAGTDDAVAPADDVSDAADDDASSDVDVPDVDDTGLADGPTDDLDLDVDVDGGLDLAAEVDTDDVFTADGLDDAPAELSHDFEDLL